MITHEEFIDSAKTYYVLDSIGKLQDSCTTWIKQSITDENSLQLYNSDKDPTAKVNAGGNKKEFPDGPIYLKIKSLVLQLTQDPLAPDHDKHMTRYDALVTPFKNFVKAQLDAP